MSEAERVRRFVYEATHRTDEVIEQFLTSAGLNIVDGEVVDGTPAIETGRTKEQSSEQSRRTEEDF